MSVNETLVASLSVVIEPAHSTTHLPPDRAVITTPALVALMERCIAAAEGPPDAEGSRWHSISAEIRHRAGAKIGESLTVMAVRDAEAGHQRAIWSLTVTAADGRLIAEGAVERTCEAP